jgi:hypothetical protein
MVTVRLSPVFVMAHLWLAKGWQVVPCQPGTKKLVKGFGIHQERITSGEMVNYWFQERNTNLGVVAPSDGLILDFDKLAVYNKFCELWPELGASYTESTPGRNGRHLFMRTNSSLPPGLVLVSGIEVKTLVLAYPSQVNGKYYKMMVPGPILVGNVQEALKPFIEPGGDKLLTSPTVRIVGRSVANKQYRYGAPQLIEELKAQWPIRDYLAYFEPGLILVGNSRWLHGRCPWHEGHHADSLWVDTERGHWGCHSENITGDVIDWHLRRLGTNSISATIRDLARYQVEVGQNV